MGLIARKVLQLFVVVVLATLFTFSLLRLLPGSAAEAAIPFGTPAQREQFNRDNGLDKPFFEQYVTWLGNLAHGDFGKDYANNLEVSDKIRNALPVSLQLMLYAQLMALAVAIPLGVLTGYRAGTKTDAAINVGAFALLALPSFVLALVLAYFVGVRMATPLTLARPDPRRGILAGLAGRRVRAADGRPGAPLRHDAPPAISLAAGLIAVYMRLLRSDMIATLQEDFITMARAKGLSNRRILWRHAFKPSSLTLLTVAGLNFGTLVGGAVAVEIIFGIPGIGQLIYQAISARQYVGAPELHRDHRHRLRAHQLRHRHALHRARPEDPSCPSRVNRRPPRWARSLATRRTARCRPTPRPSTSPPSPRARRRAGSGGAGYASARGCRPPGWCS